MNILRALWMTVTAFLSMWQFWLWLITAILLTFFIKAPFLPLVGIAMLIIMHMLFFIVFWANIRYEQEE